MTIFLDTIELNPDLRLEPTFEQIPKVAVETMNTRGGNALRWEKQLKDRSIDIVGGSDWGILEFSTIQAIDTLSQTLDGVWNLDYHGTIIPVYFRHSEGQVIEYTSVFGGIPTADTPMVDIRIKLVWKVA